MTASPRPTTDTPLDRLRAKLTRVKDTGRGSFMARCPVHDDDTQSLSVSTGTDGRALLKCHAGCATAAIVAALGMSMSDLYATPSPYAPTRTTTAPTTRTLAMVKTYDYTDESGALLFQSCRFLDSATGKKSFRQRTPDGKGGWVWSLKEVEPVLYRLPEVVSAVEDGKRIFIVEGEKDADALAELGYPATTCPMGAGKWKETFSATLKGADVVILPDNDEPGAAHAEQVAASLTAQQGTVKIVPLPGLPPKGDVSDWLDAGHDLDELEALIGTAPRWTADAMQAMHKTRWRLDELLDNDSIMRPPPAIVPRIAWAGRSTLLAAREKAGKSTLVGYITACVTHGEPFLGAPCAKGPVLVIGLEEFIGDTARRLRHFGADPTQVYLVDRFAGEPALRPEEFRAHVEYVGPVLVIVDSLTAYSHGQIQDDNNATQMAQVVQPLTDSMHQLGAALIIIHHTTKGTDRSRGSTAITAAVDMVVEFSTPNEDADPTLRRVRSVGRFPVPRVYDIRYNGDTYTLADSVETPLDEKILALITDRPTCSANDVAVAVGGRHETVLSRIAGMIASGQIRDTSTTGKGRKLVVPGHPLAPML